MNWELEVIGARAGSPDQYGPASGYLLRVGSTTLLLDCGPGVVAQLAIRGVLDDIDALIISHRHLDHSGDLMVFAYHRAFPHIQAPIPMFAPTGFSDYVAQLDVVHGIPTLPALARPVADQLPLTEVVPGSTFEVNGIRVDTVAALHPVPTISMSFPDIGLVYTADTALTSELTRLAASSRALLSEATYVDGVGHDFNAHGHMSGIEAGQLAAGSGASHLLLTHLSSFAQAEPTWANAERHFQGAIDLAVPGLRVGSHGGDTVELVDASNSREILAASAGS